MHGMRVLGQEHLGLTMPCVPRKRSWRHRSRHHHQRWGRALCRLGGPQGDDVIGRHRAGKPNHRCSPCQGLLTGDLGKPAGGGREDHRGRPGERDFLEAVGHSCVRVGAGERHTTLLRGPPAPPGAGSPPSPVEVSSRPFPSVDHQPLTAAASLAFFRTPRHPGS